MFILFRGGSRKQPPFLFIHISLEEICQRTFATPFYSIAVADCVVENIVFLVHEVHGTIERIDLSDRAEFRVQSILNPKFQCLQLLESRARFSRFKEPVFYLNATIVLWANQYTIGVSYSTCTHAAMTGNATIRPTSLLDSGVSLGESWMKTVIQTSSTTAALHGTRHQFAPFGMNFYQLLFYQILNGTTDGG